jgi:lysozyme
MTPLEEMLIKHEGLRLKPYKDSVGKTTIGIGRNLDDIGISKDEAIVLLRNDIKTATYEANKYPWFKVMNEPRQNVIISMIFNLGAVGFSHFKQTITYLENGQYELASAQMLKSKWATQVGKRAIELSEMIRTGQF